MRRLALSSFSHVVFMSTASCSINPCLHWISSLNLKQTAADVLSLRSDKVSLPLCIGFSHCGFDKKQKLPLAKIGQAADMTYSHRCH